MYRAKIIHLAIFISAILLGLWVWDRIRLPFSNPEGIVGVLAAQQFNPANNQLRFLAFVGLPLVFLVVLYFLSGKFRERLFPKGRVPVELSDPKSFVGTKWVAAALVVFAVLVSLNVITYASSKWFDTFHEGESLGAAVSVMKGMTPYKDISFTHGIYEDPARSVLAFKLFGRSIGAARTLQSVHKLLAYLLLALFLIKIFRGNYLYPFFIFMVFFALSPEYTLSSVKWLDVPWLNPLMIPPRDVMVFAFLCVSAWIYDFVKDHSGSSRLFLPASFLWAFIPALTFSYSLDRAVYLAFSYAVLAALVYFLFFKNTALGKIFVTGSLAGGIAGFLILGAWIQWDFGAFWKYFSFITSKEVELQFSYIFNIRNGPYFILSVMVAFNAYWITHRFLCEMDLKNFIQKYFVETLLFLLSVLLFRSALGRSDFVHVAYVSGLVWILSLWIVTKHWIHPLLTKDAWFGRMIFRALFAVPALFFFMLAWNLQSQNLLRENFPLKVPDDEFISPPYKPAIAYLRQNLGEGEEFFTMTSELSWYYFLDKAVPTRLPLVVIAVTPEHQRAIVEDLKSRNVKYVLWDNPDGTNENDGINNEMRLPILCRYIKENYELDRVVEGNVILKKR